MHTTDTLAVCVYIIGIAANKQKMKGGKKHIVHKITVPYGLMAQIENAQSITL